MDKKAHKVSRLAEAVLKLVAQAGPEGLSFAWLARSARVSRSWIYKYGGTREELIVFAAEHFGRMFLSLEQSQDSVSTRDDWVRVTTENFGNLLEHTSRQPLVVMIYFRFRGTQSPLGKSILRLEQIQSAPEIAQLQKLFKLTPAKAKCAAEVIGSTRMGLAHAWAYGELSELSSLDEAKGHFRAAVEGVLSGLAR